jgi:rhodanese-related sulfurtransferase
VFTGDTLLINGCGRTDFQSGSAAMLFRSITEVLFALPDETIVWPAHDYNERSCSTIGDEKKSNARVAGKSLAEFVKIMDELNLPRPKRIDEAVPANQSSGLRHDAGGGDAKPAQGYAGAVTPQQAFEWWQKGDAVLVDVRTDAEREWVGFIPGAANVVWKQWPGMKVNADFDEQIRKAVPPGKKALLMCRSGVRSAAAAKRATELGIESYNVLEGFEGDPDENGQRNKRGGWRMRGLPWRQG